MSAGTIALTNNSANVTGTGTAFTTDLKAGDFVVAIVGGVTYTLGVKAITSATALTLITAYGGPTASANAWTAVPNASLVGITAQVAADVAKAIRGLNLDKANWQQVFSGTGNITVTLPDGSTYTGPSWNYLANNTLSSQAAFFSGDANTITVNGIYSPTATATNVPIAVTGVLEHYNRYGNSQMVQIFHSVGTSAATLNKHYIRTGAISSGVATWSAWQIMFNGGDTIPIANGGTGAPTAAAAKIALGLNGLGLMGGAISTNFTAIDSIVSALRPYGFVGFRNNVTMPAGYDLSPNAASIWCQPSNVADTWFMMNVPYLNTPIRIMSGYGSAGVTMNRTLRDSMNTGVDTNGFIKAASPIVNIFADGTAETNNESEGVTVSRTAVGEYLVEGCLGLNSDTAWGGSDGGFELPADRNGQPLIWLDYEVNADGAIIVKTYHRTHDSSPVFARNTIDGFKNGDPVDIPKGRFISVRVEMPEDSVFNRLIAEAAAFESSLQESHSS